MRDLRRSPHHRSVLLSAVAFLSLSALGTSAVHAQVRVEARLEKSNYIVGEPIFVTADVTNLLAEPIAYHDRGLMVGGGMALEVAGLVRPRPFADRLAYCREESGIHGVGAVDHPPLIRPGETRSFRYLLTGYELPPGKYRLRATGRVNLSWKYYPSDDTPAHPTPLARALDGQPLNGSAIDQTFVFSVEPGSSSALAVAYEPYLAAANGAVGALDGSDARMVILTLAPAFLEDAIARFTLSGAAGGDGLGFIGADALGRIGTVSSKAVLREARQIARTSADDGLHAHIVAALAAAATLDDTRSLIALMTEAGAPERARGNAALGLGRIGSSDSIRALEQALPPAGPELRKSIIGGLSLSKSPLAVEALIRATPAATREQLRTGIFYESADNICGALAALTHYRWCDGRAIDAAVIARRWSRWWDAYGARVRLFGNDACVLEERMPVLPE